MTRNELYNAWLVSEGNLQDQGQIGRSFEDFLVEKLNGLQRQCIAVENALAQKVHTQLNRVYDITEVGLGEEELALLDTRVDEAARQILQHRGWGIVLDEGDYWNVTHPDGRYVFDGRVRPLDL